MTTPPRCSPSTPGTTRPRSALSPWSILIESALAGQANGDGVSSFCTDHRKSLASLIAALPDDTDLSTDHVEAIVALATFTSPGVRLAKTTKVAAAFRPRAVPIIDSKCCNAFGLSVPETEAKTARTVRAITEAYAVILGDHRDTLTAIREVAVLTAPIYRRRDIISNLRLLDIIIWCAQNLRDYTGRDTTRAWNTSTDAPATDTTWMTDPESWTTPTPIPLATPPSTAPSDG